MVLVGGTVHRVAVFLAEQARSHGGREKLSDLLNDPGEFIPTECLATGRPIFFRRQAITLAKLPLEREPDDPVSLTLPSEHDVDLLLADGSKFSGLLTYVAPPERSRLVDYLEDSPPFFPVIRDESLYLLNKAHVLSVTPSNGNHGSTRPGH